MQLEGEGAELGDSLVERVLRVCLQQPNFHLLPQNDNWQFPFHLPECPHLGDESLITLGVEEALTVPPEGYQKEESKLRPFLRVFCVPSLELSILYTWTC